MVDITTDLGVINVGSPSLVPSGGFTDIDELLRSRTPAAADILKSGTQEAFRLSRLGMREFDPLRRFGGLGAFQEQQALLGLSGDPAQRRAIEAIPVSEAEQEQQRRESETLMRRAAATGDISGATLLNAIRLGGAQRFENIQNRLAQLEPLAETSRTIRSSLSQAEESQGAREAQLSTGLGTALANIRLGAAAPQISSIQQRADISGLRGLAAARQRAQIGEQVAGLAGRFAPQMSQGFTNLTKGFSPFAFLGGPRQL